MLTTLRSSRGVRSVLAVRAPFGLVSVRYLVPGLSAHQRLHRRLLLTGGPARSRGLVAALNAWHWAGWVTFGAWRASWRAVAGAADSVASAHGVARGRLLRSVLFHALVHGVPPRDYLAFELYRPERQAIWWSYVFTVEVAGFHRWRDGGRDTAAAHRLLADKVEFARRVQAAGVPVVPTLATVRANASAAELLAAIEGLGETQLLCKPRRGSAMRGVFRVAVDSGGLLVQRLDGRTVADDEVDAFLARGLGFGESIVQPYVETAAEFAAVGAAAGEALVLRLITERSDNGVTVYSAAFEVPMVVDDSPAGYTQVVVDLGTGALCPDRSPITARSPAGRAAQRAIVEDAAGRRVPGWRELLAHAAAAHDEVPDLYSVAWDFIIGGDGPVLLEGNAGWGTTPPQIIHGPLLAERTTR